MPDLLPFVIAGLGTAATYVLSGVGLVVLFRASGVLNFAQGALGAMSAFVAWSLINAGYWQPLSWLAGIIVAVVLSLIYGRFIAPKLARRDPIVRAVATLAFALVLLGVMEVIWGEAPRRLRLPIDNIGVYVFGVRIVMSRAAAFGIAVIATISIMLFLSRTRLGLDMRALANNRDLSALLGIRVLRADAWAWIISGALAGIAGIFLANLDRLSPLSLTFLIIPAVAAAVVGRFVSLPATVVGGLIIGVGEAIATPFALVSSYRSAVSFIFAVLVLLWFQRRGLTIYRTAGDD